MDLFSITGLLTVSGHLKSNVRLTVTAAAKTEWESVHAEDAPTCKPEITAPNNTSCTQANVAANGASLTSSRKNNNYIRGSFLSTGFLTTCPVDIKPDPDTDVKRVDDREDGQTNAALQDQLSTEPSQPSCKY